MGPGGQEHQRRTRQRRTRPDRGTGQELAWHIAVIPPARPGVRRSGSRGPAIRKILRPSPTLRDRWEPFHLLECPHWASPRILEVALIPQRCQQDAVPVSGVFPAGCHRRRLPQPGAGAPPAARSGRAGQPLELPNGRLAPFSMWARRACQPAGPVPPGRP